MRPTVPRPQADQTIDAVIVGGGPGGLAVAQQLGARGFSSIILEKGTFPGWMWAQTYDSLCLHTGKHLSALPGMPFAKGTNLFPSRAEFLSYLESYTERFSLPLTTGVEARALKRRDGVWQVETNEGTYAARAVVAASGIMSSPVLPNLPGMETFKGELIHSSLYRRPEGYARKRVLVVGIGNSGAEIAVEFACAGARVAVSVRSGANVVPRSVAGLPTQYLGWGISWLPRGAQLRLTRLFGLFGAIVRGGNPIPRKRGQSNCPDVPLIGLKLTNAIQSGSIALLPGIVGLTADGANFADGSKHGFASIVFATGYRAAVEWMGSYAERDECGFAKRRDRVRSMTYPDLYFIGHNYDGRGGLYNIAVDAKRIARHIVGG